MGTSHKIQIHVCGAPMIVTNHSQNLLTYWHGPKAVPPKKRGVCFFVIMWTYANIWVRLKKRFQDITSLKLTACYAINCLAHVRQRDLGLDHHNKKSSWRHTPSTLRDDILIIIVQSFAYFYSITMRTHPY